MTNPVEEVLHLDIYVQRERGGKFEGPLGHRFCLLGWKGVHRISQDGLPRKKLKTMTNLFGKKQEAEAVAVPSTRTLDDDSEPFLLQVKRSLTDDEYTQFVGLIQDYASEPMIEDQVFKSVVKLFSIKDRDELLERFKENLTKRRQQKVEKYREQERQMGKFKN